MNNLFLGFRRRKNSKATSLISFRRKISLKNQLNKLLEFAQRWVFFVEESLCDYKICVFFLLFLELSNDFLTVDAYHERTMNDHAFIYVYEFVFFWIFLSLMSDDNCCYLLVEFACDFYVCVREIYN